ncbi:MULTISPECIES: GNAT family N-acetyltransferase [Arthrobacter]|uniref:GNAT family N-acetyltransferase n=2 Tax=Arthrobacter TaxID=1663 RepID=A0ABU9KJA2_9MICC|nr:GNAT family N-acetyltransferase [Arthrobacter sp. YJM1]MDP5226848.1 GNAT family N-acetyltransferase [Arthrobacter sp. YJM1]
MTSITLVPPTAGLHDSWLASWDEWGTLDQDGASAFLAEKLGLDLRKPEDFAEWVRVLVDMGRPGATPPEGMAPQSTLWVVEDGEYLGAVGLRHVLSNEYLAEAGGHIGYGIRPSARRRGLATLALQASLQQARDLGLDRVLVTCRDSNTGSVRTIEGAGGVLEEVRPVERYPASFGLTEPMRRYWIEL